MKINLYIHPEQKYVSHLNFSYVSKSLNRNYMVTIVYGQGNVVWVVKNKVNQKRFRKIFPNLNESPK